MNRPVRLAVPQALAAASGQAAMMALAVVMALAAVVACGGCSAFGWADRGPRDFYLSSAGDDQAKGDSPQSAWRTLERLRRVRLVPGDRVLLRGGDRFAGTVSITRGEAGDPRRPVQLTSYGAGRATIAAAGVAAVDVQDTSGVRITALDVTGDAAAYASVPGISVWSGAPGPHRHSGITIEEVRASGFKLGIAIGATAGAAGWHDVAVRRAELHGNRDFGLLAYGPPLDPAEPWYAVHQILVSEVEAHGQRGNPADTQRNSGSGITLGSVRGGRIESSVAHHNGELCRAPEGPVGIWAYDSTEVVITRSLSYANRTSRADGGGFDLDQNVSRSVVAGNLSWGNDGPGFLVYTARDNDLQRGNVIRDNISSGDARRSSRYGAVTVEGRVTDLVLERNTVVSDGPGPALLLTGPVRQVAVRDSIFVAAGRGDVLRASAVKRGAVAVHRSVLHRPRGAWRAVWDGAPHTSLAALGRAAGWPIGAASTADPQLVALSHRPQARELGPNLAAGLRVRDGAAVFARGAELP